MTTHLSNSQAYDQLIERTRKASLLGSTAGLLSWDQETMMPPRGLDYRAEQISQLSRMVHELSTDPIVGELLQQCEQDKSIMADPHSDAAANVREIRRSYDKATKLPAELVQEMAKTTSMARHEWVLARKDNDFARFKPWLEKIVALTRQKAQCYGWPKGGEAWDALADDYEAGTLAKDVQAVFEPLRDRLSKLVAELMAGTRRPPSAFHEITLPIEHQQAFVRIIAGQIGFDFERGRLDVSAHPFCSGTHCNDVRLTTRFSPTKLADAIGSTMHEAGHGIYEQNLPEQHIGTPLGEAVGLSVHESQSRMWENFVGRSRAFWQWCHPKLRDHFGQAVAGLSFDDVYAGVNIVKPDLIRVEADEATYNLHIMVRFEIERVLVSGELDVADLPEVWNRKYRDYLGIEVPDDAHGCMQDIHWSLGAIGYFPTYTLGNLFAAQLFEQAITDIPDLHEQFARGQFGSLQSWLTDKIHRHGKRYTSKELCQRVTGKPLSADPLLRHLERKLRPLYV